MTHRLIMHVDMDAFFAAIEQRDNPELRGKPVVVGALPGGRGVVSTCSYEARKFGIHSAMPISEAWRRCPDAVYLRPDFKRYLEASSGLMELLGEISPIVEPVSVDEAYVDISGLGRLFGTPHDIARRAQGLVAVRLQLAASIGVGPTRSVAKIASEQKKPNGLTVVEPQDVQRFLAPLSVTALRGVGKVTQQRLNREGLRLVRHIQELELAALERLFGRNQALHLYNQAHGQSSDSVGEAPDRKQISKETTFSEDVEQRDVIADALLELSCQVGRSARHAGVCGQVVTVKYRFTGFETHTRQRKLERPTNRDLAIYEEGQALLAAADALSRPLRLVGIGLSALVPEGKSGAGLFADRKGDKQGRLYKTLDRIADKYGGQAVGPAVLRRGRDEE